MSTKAEVKPQLLPETDQDASPKDQPTPSPTNENKPEESKETPTLGEPVPTNDKGEAGQDGPAAEIGQEPSQEQTNEVLPENTSQNEIMRVSEEEQIRDIFNFFKHKGKVRYGKIYSILESLLSNTPPEVAKDIKLEPLMGMDEVLDFEGFKSLMQENSQIFEMLKS